MPLCLYPYFFPHLNLGLLKSRMYTLVALKMLMFYSNKYIKISKTNKKVEIPRLELGLLDYQSSVLTILLYLQEAI